MTSTSTSTDFFDPAYEFDCPKYYDFAAGSPRHGPPADSWFGPDPDAIEIGAEGVIELSPSKNTRMSTTTTTTVATPIVDATVNHLHWTVEEDDKRASITQQIKATIGGTIETTMTTTTTATTTSTPVIDVPLEDDGDVHSIRQKINFTNSPTHATAATATTTSASSATTSSTTSTKPKSSVSVPSSPVASSKAPLRSARASMAITPRASASTSTSTSTSTRRPKRKSAEKSTRDRTRSPARRASCMPSAGYRSTPSQHKRRRENAPVAAAPAPVAAPAPAKEGPTPANTVAKPAKLTVAKSPRFATKSRVGRLSHAMSASDLELAEIEAKRAHQRRLAAINARNAHLLINSVADNVHPVRSTKTLTQPTAFQFRTEERLKKDEKKKAATDTRPGAKPRTGHGGITQPIPFSFETDKRIKGQAPTTEFVSFVQQAQNFLRHDSHSHRDSISSAAGDLAVARPLTQPRAPQLRTQQRERRSILQSTEEQELARLQALPKFKARPINEKIFASAAGDLGVPRIPKAAPTEFAEFHLVTPFRTRSESLKPTEEVEAEEAAKHQFKAQPFRKEVFTGPDDSVDPREVVLRRAQSSHGVTIPATPQLATKKRKSVSPRHDESEPEYVFRARPMPVFEPIVHQEPAKKSKVVVQPFHLATEERGKQKEEMFEQRIAEEQAALKQQAQFHARPMIVTEPQEPVIPHRTVHASPFKLRSVELADEAKQKFLAKLQAERERELATFSSFRAQPPKVLTQPPALLIKKSQRPLTEIEPFHLPTDERAQHRLSYEAEKAEKERQREAELAQRERERLEREEAERAAYRASLIHKPQPIATPVKQIFQQVKRKPFGERNGQQQQQQQQQHISKHSSLRIQVDEETMGLELTTPDATSGQENSSVPMSC